MAKKKSGRGNADNDQNQQKQEVREIPCPSCGVDIPKDARYCPYCKAEVAFHCKGCGKTQKTDWTLCPFCGHTHEAKTGTAMQHLLPVSEHCHLCRKQVPDGAKYCPHCNSHLGAFKRICPECSREIDLKANSCGGCGAMFPLTWEKAQYIVCRGCRRRYEIDDWMADRRLPFLFHTEREVKIKCFDNPGKTEEVHTKYFRGSAWWEIERDDTKPWEFQPKMFPRFLNGFSCICGTRNWTTSRLERITSEVAKIAAPKLTEVGKQGRSVLAQGVADLWKYFTERKKT